MDIMILGGVPIMVIMPPKILAKAKGIRMRLGERPCSPAVFSATGSSSANAPTLFMNADSTAATTHKLVICISWFWASGMIRLAMRSTTPELRNARLITNTAATVMTAAWPKPSRACAGSIRADSPRRNTFSSSTSAITSENSPMTATTS